MKKFGLLIFITALAVGLVFGNVISFGKLTGKIFNFSIKRGVQGSGNLVSEKRDLRDFDGIDVGGVFQVEIVAQKDFSVEIEADDNLLPLIKTEVRGGTLTIETERTFSTRNTIKVRISAPNIERMEISGASNVSLVAAKTENLQIDSSGASKISVSGEAGDLIVDVSGAGKIDAENLKSERVTIDASGASSVSVYAVTELKADASGASKIIYSGSPKELVKKISGASSVKQK